MLTYAFKDQLVIVTGGTRGIGRAVVEMFLDAHATVIATYTHDDAAADALHESWKGPPERLRIQKFDISDYAQVEAFYRDIDNEFDQLHVLVNNAGVRADAVVGMMAPDDWRRVIDIDLTGTYNMSKFAVLKMMQARYGRIVTITSAAHDIGFAGQANYAAAKAGQEGFTRALAKEVAKRQITVNCVSPGFVATGFLDGLSEKQVAEYRAAVPMHRFADPRDVANCVLFLASEEAAYVTGTVLRATGGL